jgi:hypothetical protein
LWQPRFFYKKGNKKIDFFFPHHSINNENVGSIERDAKPRTKKNSRKSNKNKKNVTSKTYCL